MIWTRQVKREHDPRDFHAAGVDVLWGPREWPAGGVRIEVSLWWRRWVLNVGFVGASFSLGVGPMALTIERAPR